MSKNISIHVPSLTRVEGEGSLTLDIIDGRINKLNFKIYEPPRFFEKFLQGREYNQVIDIVARICGICPVAYQMSAVQAIENCFNMTVSPWVALMRRVLYCGEWIESHSLHMHLLALPDFFGFNSAIEMAKEYPEVITRGMRLQALGNQLVAFLGKRSVHPIGVCVGGFYKAPNITEAQLLYEQLQEGLTEAENLLKFLATLTLPNEQDNYTAVCISNPKQYAMIDGDIVSSQDLTLSPSEFYQRFKEHQVPHSTALHCLLDDHPYLVGPLARVNMNHKYLPQAVQSTLTQLNISCSSNNIFHSILARGIEIYFAFYEAQRLLSEYEYTNTAHEKVTPRAGVGYGCTEAPRGMLWHRYQMTADGTVMKADIIPPTSQNQAQIEQNLKASLECFGLDKDDDALRLHSEMVIRNYDPCISCSTHFLNLKVRRQ